MRTTDFFLLLIFAIVPLAQLEGQSTLNVPSTTYPTIQSAINAAVTGDTVLVAAGTYVENLVWGNQDITVLGAGVGQSIVDGGGVAPCLLMDKQTTVASTLDGFTLTNGLGAPSDNGMTQVPSGGGIYMVKSIHGYPAATIRNCEVSYCVGDMACAAHIRFPTVVNFENVHFHNNNQSSTGGWPGGGIWISTESTEVSFSNCRFDGGAGNTVLGVTDGASLSLSDCIFENNTTVGNAVGATTSGDVSIRRCTFRNNVCTNPQHPCGIGISAWGNLFEMSDCLFHGNSGGASVVSISAPPTSEVRNLTVAQNQLGVVGGGVFSGLNLDLENVISWGNVDSAGNLPPFQYVWPGNVLTVSNSIIEGGITGGTAISTANPMFVDPLGGDFRLLPGSPAVDSGIPMGVDPTDLDLDGNPRTSGQGIDMGAYESNTIAHHPASEGKVGLGQGGPYDILAINGSSGDAFRTITVPIGTASIVEMLQPPSSAAPLDFSIFGLLGEATLDTIWNVPFGIGEMGFAPAPAAPFFQPILFTYASTVGPIQGVVPFFPATLTPWNSGVGPAIPFPLTLTFQGVVADTNNVFTPTNLIIYKVE